MRKPWTSGARLLCAWLALAGPIAAQDVALDADPRTRTLARLVRAAGGPAAANRFLSLSPDARSTYLDTFWASANPLIRRYYVGHHLGERHYTVSDAFFERGELIPKEFHTGYEAPDSVVVADALSLSDTLVAASSTDPVALCTRGYVLLEAGRAAEAETYFIEAIRVDDRYPEAHNGRGLAYLPQRKRLTDALTHFRNAIASDSAYPAAIYNLAMCHLAMGSIDLDHRFGMVTQRFPDHYDAHFKLGVAYEDLYDFKRAAGAYSGQLAVTPNHDRARARLARVNLEMSWTSKRHYDIPEVQALVDRDPLRYLPLLGETYLAKEEYEPAADTYRRYFRLIRRDIREHFEDISLLLSPEEAERYAEADRGLKRRMADAFWLMNDPTPTTPVNERRLEHYRRVHYALQNFGLGQKPFDKRGEVYVRFGHPDHRSWSRNIIFETEEDVVRVKNRLNDRTFEIRGEILPDDLRHGGEGLFASREMGEIRGFPVFPIPHSGSRFRDGATLDARWESWIYAKVDGGIELSFVDYLGDGRFTFARTPQSSPNYHIWLELAPETVFAKAISPEPSHFVFDYGGLPLTLHLDHAAFRGTKRRTNLELYFAVPRDELGLEMLGDRIYGRFDRAVVLYDEDGKEAFRDSARFTLPIRDTGGNADDLMITQLRAGLGPGRYVLGARISDPGTGRIQIARRRIDLPAFPTDTLAVSGIQVAAELGEDLALGPEFAKGELAVLPLPTRAFGQGSPVYLYYEVYNLLRDRNGQTRYRVDYRVRGGAPGVARRLLGSVARFLGRDDGRNEAAISYVHEGFEASEPLYVALDLTAEGRGDVEVEVVVTDLKQLDEPSVSRRVTLTIGE